MFRKILLLTLLGIVVAGGRKRFLFNNGQSSFPNSPFGGGGSGGSSPFGSGSGSGGSMTSHSGYTPCVPTHAMCSLQCATGYIKGPGGCDFCMCDNSVQSGTTLGPVLVDPVDGRGMTTTAPLVPQVSTQGPTGSTGTTDVDCLAAKLSCATTCGEKGYLVDPSDCTFCLCKSAISK